jgi:heme exporter protein A
LETGQLLAVRGPNGAGKSSLLRLIAGLLAPRAGSICLDGGGEEPAAHYLGHLDALKPAASLRETLRFWTVLYGGGAGLADRGAERAATVVGLAHALDLPTGVLSAGQRRRAALARLALVPRPLWLLDEPATTLDRDGEALLGRLLGEHLAAGGLAVAATHQPLPRAPDITVELVAA